MPLFSIGWVLLSALFVLFELVSPGLFFFLSLACGSLAAACVAALFADSGWQLVAFSVITIITFFMLKKWVKTTSKNTMHMTNSYALVGKRGTVIKEMSATKKGWVLIAGEQWSGYARGPEILTQGDLIEVVDTSGSHLIVKKITS